MADIVRLPKLHRCRIVAQWSLRRHPRRAPRGTNLRNPERDEARGVGINIAKLLVLLKRGEA